MPETTVAFKSWNLDFYFTSCFKTCKYEGISLWYPKGKKLIEFRKHCKMDVWMDLKHGIKKNLEDAGISKKEYECFQYRQPLMEEKNCTSGDIWVCP